MIITPSSSSSLSSTSCSSSSSPCPSFSASFTQQVAEKVTNFIHNTSVHHGLCHPFHVALVAGKPQVRVSAPNHHQACLSPQVYPQVLYVVHAHISSFLSHNEECGDATVQQRVISFPSLPCGTNHGETQTDVGCDSLHQGHMTCNNSSYSPPHKDQWAVGVLAAVVPKTSSNLTHNLL